MKEIKIEVLIKADCLKIWIFFNKFENFPEWNPFIHYLKGNLSPGNIIKVKITPPDAMSMIFKPKVLNVIPNQEIRWTGNFISPFLFKGEHVFLFIDNKDKTTTFIQKEKFTGILVPFLKKMLDKTKQGFELMNMKLKEKCE